MFLFFFCGFVSVIFFIYKEQAVAGLKQKKNVLNFKRKITKNKNQKLKQIVLFI